MLDKLQFVCLLKQVKIFIVNVNKFLLIVKRFLIGYSQVVCISITKCVLALTLCAHITVLAHTLSAYIAVLAHTLCTHIKVLAHIG